MIKIIIILLVILFIPIVFFACMASGDKAIVKMNKEEKQYFEEKIMKIEIGTSYEEVIQILGMPDRGDGTKRPSWKAPKSKNNSQIAIYLSDKNTVRKIRWMKIGQFVWEKSS